MRTATPRLFAHALLAVTALAATSCSDRNATSAPSDTSTRRTSRAWRIALATHTGDRALDKKIRDAQQRLTKDPRPKRAEKLGWLFVQKARQSYDPGYYTVAEACADVFGELAPDALGDELLRGHVRHSLHDFAAAETIARKLVSERGAFFDHGLLGDVLLDRGALDEALASYQKMLDLKPCLQSYVRAGQARWLRGDLDGARKLFELGVGAGSRRAPEALAWAWTRLARLHHQEKRHDAARKAAREALAAFPDCAAALLILGRVELAAGETKTALPHFERAAQLNPLPEFLWAQADALRLAGHEARARAVEDALEASGATDDPRTYALYLATRRKRCERARSLALREVAQRRDVHTLDAVAWSHFANQELERAQEAMDAALREGTRDARLYLHAALIARARGVDDARNSWLHKAQELRHDLLPSERAQL